MNKIDKFDISTLFILIKKDIEDNYLRILWYGLVSFIVSFILLPIAIGFFFALLHYADLPYFDNELISIYKNTKFFLIPYDIMLLYYFGVMYFKNKKLHITNKKHYKKAIIFLIFSLIVSFIAIYFQTHFFITIIYFGFFILSIYYLSYTYYDIALKDAFDNLKNPLYKGDDLGWISSQGVLDNPFSYKDDLNRAKLFVQTSTVGFDFVIIFLNQTVSSLLFWYAIQHKSYIKESTKLFDFILESGEDKEYFHFSYLAFNILKNLNYIQIDNHIRLTKKGLEVADNAKR